MSPRCFAPLALLAAALGCFFCCASASVPAVVVSSSPNSLSRLASSRLDARQLADALHDAVGSGLLLVVTIDEGLGLADFARFGGDIYATGGASGSGAFANVAGLSAKLGGPHLLVADAGNFLTSLRGLDWSGGAPVEVAGANVDRVVEAAGATRLVIARAADAGAADKLIGAACSALQSRGLPFVAVFTATRESTPPPAAVGEAADSAGRHLLAAPTASPGPNGTFVNCSGDVLLYFGSLQVQFTQDGTVRKLPHVAPIADGSSIIDTALSQCNAAGGNRTLALSFPKSVLPSPMIGLKLILNFIGDARLSSATWRISSGSASLTCAAGSSPSNCSSLAETALTAQSLASFSTPNGSCYHCTSGAKLITVGGGSTSNTTIALAFGKFQLQPFGVASSDGRFSKHVNDCVGFFSVEVWFSLLVLLVVTVILMYGVLMLVSVATPDRFDDPKGKTIQVNVQEG